MSGSFRVETGDGEAAPGLFLRPRGKDPAHDHVLFRLESGARVVYNDPRRFGFMDLVVSERLSEHKLFRALGLEPLSEDFTPEALARRLAGRSTAIKAALLDQSVVAGLGNIYVCEALFRSGIAPRREARALARADGRPTRAAERLVTVVKDVLREAIEAGGSSLRDHRRTDGALGYFQHSFAVYDREGRDCLAPGCRGRVQRIAQGGRSTFYCAVCQRT
jgi:formamidopyrimidine-DNA glycosylase